MEVFQKIISDLLDINQQLHAFMDVGRLVRQINPYKNKAKGN